ncbi:MAG: hypothetical protein WAM11_03865 [Cyanobium sp.]
MPSPDPDPLAPGWPVGGSANTDLCQLVAAAADLCCKPWRHAVIGQSTAGGSLQVSDLDRLDGALRLEVRGPDGVRQPEQDLELELYRSGPDLHLTLGWCDDERPMLWHGHHPVWMNGTSGERCARPQDGAPLEALARRLRALLV